MPVEALYYRDGVRNICIFLEIYLVLISLFIARITQGFSFTIASSAWHDYQLHLRWKMISKYLLAITKFSIKTGICAGKNDCRGWSCQSGTHKECPLEYRVWSVDLPGGYILQSKATTWPMGSRKQPFYRVSFYRSVYNLTKKSGSSWTSPWSGSWGEIFARPQNCWMRGR